MNVSFHGAARSVTGSRHLIEAGNSRVLLDCGMFQGRRGESDRRNRELGVEPRWLDAVILSHAHIDHSGALPILTQHAFRGRVHATEATCDLTQLMLEDSARIQEQDCQYVNKRERRRRGTWREPYYNTNDVRAIVRRFSGERYHQDFKVTPTITARFYDAGHILGSTAIHVTISQRGTRQSILFTGDLGRSGMPILRDPDPPPPVTSSSSSPPMGIDFMKTKPSSERKRPRQWWLMPSPIKAKSSSQPSPLAALRIS